MLDALELSLLTTELVFATAIHPSLLCLPIQLPDNEYH